MNNQKTTLIIVGVIAALAAITAPSLLVNSAFANVKGTTDTDCTNGHNQPPGQQPTCTGGGLTQETCHSTTGNGNCPKGQNK